MSNTNEFIIENGEIKKYNGPGGEVIIPDGVETIGHEAFMRNTAIKRVVLANSVTFHKSQ